jgi:diguanylate cyclase (GGDEF)-like protein/PAS domain S-box-containing protein
MTPVDPDFYKDLLDHMSDGVYFVDRERRILYWNQGAVRLTGYKADEVVGRLCQDDILCHMDAAGHRLCVEGCPLSQSIADGRTHEANVFLRHKQGRRVPVAVRIQPIRGADGSITGAVEIFNDDSAQHEVRRKTEAMRRLAFLDQVTQLPNRRFMEMSLHTALREYAVHEDPFGVLSIDLDHFKTINDQFGHTVGDRALQEVAKTLIGSLRPTDLVGRWGGDEFLAVVRHVDNTMLGELAQRCCALVAGTCIPADGKPVSLSISIGATLASATDTTEGLIQRTDTLMYQSKLNGRAHATTG